ncbi:MAG: hypothetical protein M3T56_16780 [Chloroflexota bacterium]|nr:hypothetical protein [Chloroflexota bacterium]
MDDERLRQRIVVGLDALPVPRAPEFGRAPRSSRVFPGYRSLPVSIAAAVLVAGLVIAVPMLSGGPPASPSKPTSFTDNFSSGIDRTRWNVVTQGRGPVATARNGRVELNIPAEATGGAGEPISAGLALERCFATGNYVAIVEYEILEWPPMHGVEIRFGELTPDGALITRDQYADGDSVHGRSVTRDYRQSISSATGSLRLTRKDGDVTVSSRGADGSWVELEGIQWPGQGDARFQVGVSTDAALFARQSVRIAVDNFQLTASEVTCK